MIKRMIYDMKRLLTVLMVIFVALAASAQPAGEHVTVSGVVVDAQGQPVINAGIVIKGTTEGVTSDLDGKFSLSAPKGATLSIVSMGYTTKELRISDLEEALARGAGQGGVRQGGSGESGAGVKGVEGVRQGGAGVTGAGEAGVRMTGAGVTGAGVTGVEGVRVGRGRNGEIQVTVTLNEEAINLDEVVFVGYGEFSRRKITSSVAKVNGEVLRDKPISNALEGLKGAVAGLKVVQTNNTPGGGFSMKIRGGSSITNSNEPLVYVDGVERGMATVDPNDIASIDVLKDAASTAIYGSRGSNGVILITTNRGSYNRAPEITFEATVACQAPETERSFLNAEDYINVLRPAIAQSQNPKWNTASGYSASSGNTGSSIYSTRYYNEGDTLPAGWKTMADPLDPTKTLMFCDTDWQSLMFRPSMWQNYRVGLTGGSDRVRYNAGVGYTDDQGIGIATGYKRFNFKSTADVKINKFITATIGAEYQRTSSDAYASQRDAISRGLSAVPTQIAYYDDGTPAIGYNSTSQTPLYYTYYRDASNIGQNLSLDGALNVTLAKGLTANVAGSFYNTEAKSSSFMRSNYYSTAREATSTWSQTNRLKFDAYTQYEHTFCEKHNFNAMLGYTYQNRYYEYLSGTGTGSSSDKLSTLDASSETTATSTSNQDVQLGFFGRLNYDYASKYLFTAVARYDASSKFVKQNRWGLFPGMSAGWVASEEDFLKDVSWLSYLKARVSYGQTGNNGIGINDAMGQYNASYIYDGNAAIRGTVMANANLTWETTTQLDLGLEVGLWDNRVYFSGDYYNKITENMLFDESLPNTTGFGSVTTNLGKVRFWGWEFELTTKNIQTRDFAWESKLTFSYDRNVVVELPDNGMEKNRTAVSGYPIYSNGDGTYFGGLAEGEPLYRFYGYKALGIYQNAEEAAAAPFDQLARGFDYVSGTTVKGRKFAGDYNWADRNGDNIITQNQDLFCLGVTEAPVHGGISNTLTWHDFSLDVYLDYALGHSIYDESYARYFYATFSTNYALAEAVKECWQKEGDVTRYAKFWANDSGAGQDNFNRVSNVFTYKGDYLCIRQVALNYRVPQKFLNNFGVKGLTLSIGGNNLYYFTAVKGISPEIGTASTYSSSYYNYPPTRRISFTAKLSF